MSERPSGEGARRVLCAHADQNGEGAHWKNEGEPCCVELTDKRSPCADYAALRKAVEFYGQDPKRFAREANYATVKALLDEMDALVELGDDIVDAVATQVAHGHPVSVVVAYAVSQWRAHFNGVQP